MIKSTHEDAGWFTCTVGEQEVCFRRQYFEATNQPGADALMVELHAPGWNDAFACGKEGFSLLHQIIQEIEQPACSETISAANYATGLELLEQYLPE